MHGRQEIPGKRDLMSCILYYFTGTGNSLAIAQEVGKALGDSEIVSIPRLMRNNGPVIPSGNVIGIVSPVYFLGLPDIVVRFISRLDLSRVDYVFVIITMGASGASAARQCSALLHDQGHPADATFTVVMPESYLPMFEVKSEEESRPLLLSASQEAVRIASVVHDRKKETVSINPFRNALFMFINRVWKRNVHHKDKKFFANADCTSCGTCGRICPVQNISVATGQHPVWLHRCEQCFACLQFCPASAVQYGKKTTGKRRYRHPGIRVKTLLDELGEGT